MNLLWGRMETRDLNSPNASSQGDPTDGQSVSNADQIPPNGPITPMASIWLQLITRALDISNTPEIRGKSLATLIAELAGFVSASGGSIYLYTPKLELRHEASYGLSNRIARQVEEVVQTEAARRILTVLDTPVVLEDIADTIGASPSQFNDEQYP